MSLKTTEGKSKYNTEQHNFEKIYQKNYTKEHKTDCFPTWFNFSCNHSSTQKR